MEPGSIGEVTNVYRLYGCPGWRKCLYRPQLGGVEIIVMILRVWDSGHVETLEYMPYPNFEDEIPL